MTEGWNLFLEKYLSEDEEKLKKAHDLSGQHNRGAMGYESFISQVAELAGTSNQKVQEYLDDNRPNTQLFELIKQLKPTYKIGMLSNAGDDWLAEMFTEEQIGLFDDIVLSFRYGVAKPDSAIYDLALKRLSVEPEETLFIDDAEKHCTGAQEAGMKTILYKDFIQLKRDIQSVLM